MTLRFSTPSIVATPAALTLLDAANVRPITLIQRHFAGGWNGQPDNAERNEAYLRDGEGMLLSIFADVPGGPVWVISHVGYGDASYTTLLLPWEY